MFSLSFSLSPAVAQEKKEMAFREGIEGFHKEDLKTVKTEEKNPLPDKTGEALAMIIPVKSFPLSSHLPEMSALVWRFPL